MRASYVFLFLCFVLRTRLSRSQFITLTNRIVGGQTVNIEKYPYQVSLQRWSQHFCGGAIISEDWIITAAHCVINTTKCEQFPVIKAGISDFDEEGTVVQVIRIIVHANYSPSHHDYDIAVMQLEEPLAYNYQIQPISLAPRDFHYATNKMAEVSGWGAVKKDGFVTKQLYKAEVPLISSVKCLCLYKNQITITPRMLCAGYTSVGGKDSCQGDSGGPLVQYGRLLIGIVSWGIGCADPEFPGVYTRIAPFRDWIKEKTGV